MKKYEAVIILNPNLSTKVEDFVKDFQKLLKNNSKDVFDCLSKKHIYKLY